MNALFLQILNMSFTAGIVILIVLFARLFLRRSPRLFSYALWSVVLFRLICPFSFESILSLLPAHPSPIPMDIMYVQQPQINTGIRFVNDSINGVLPAATPYASMNPIQFWIAAGTLLWLLGIGIMLIYSAVSFLRLRARLKDAVPDHDNIYTCATLDSPFVLGLFRPRIYLPSTLSAEEKPYILLHEQTHIRYFDHMIKILGFFVLCLHWFNPLVWAAFLLCGRDMEMCCDERVIRELGNDVKKDYSFSLLTLATGKRIVSGTPLAFGEGDTKSRIKHVLHYKKPAIWVIAVSLLAVIVILVGLTANPREAQASAGWAADIYRYRTSYLGDNNAVSHIADKLNMPASLERTGTQLETTEPPYGLTLYYTYQSDDVSFDEFMKEQSAYDQNAMIAFSLIENLDEITFTVTGDTSMDVTRTREWAEQTADVDLWQESSSQEGFEMLAEEVVPQSLIPDTKDIPPADTASMLSSYYAGQTEEAYHVMKSNRLKRMLEQWTDESIVNPVWNYDSFTQYRLYDEATDTLSGENLYYCTFSDENGTSYDMVLGYESTAEGGGLGRVRYGKTPYPYDLRAGLNEITAALSAQNLDLSTASAFRVQLGDTPEVRSGEAILITDENGDSYLYRFDA